MMFSHYHSHKNIERFNDPSVVNIYASYSGPTPCEEYFLAKYLKASDHLLELGVGAGRLTDYLLPRSKFYIGTDYAQKMIEAAKKRFPAADFRVMDATDMSEIGSASQDVVLFSMNGIDCLPTLEARSQCIAEVQRVLKSGGYFIFSSHHSRGVVHWPDLNTDCKRKIWRVLRSGAISVNLASRRILSPVFWKGVGFAYDPADGGLRMFHSTPSFIAREVSPKGFKLLEVANSNFPRNEPMPLGVPAFKYVFQKL